MSNQPNKPNGAKSAVRKKKNFLDARRIRLALSVLGAIVAWMVVTIIVQPGTTNTIYNVPVGNTYIYGITYSSNAANNPEADIDACKSYNDVQELTISNDYASNNSTIDYAKFVSVATGYYAGDGGLPALFTVQQGSGEIGSMPT